VTAGKAPRHVTRRTGGIVHRYDPDRPPDPEQWLALDEQERSTLVEEHHRRARIDLPNATLHATIHAIVENQLAYNDDPVVRALARLMKEGLSRHDAIHAIGAVLAEHIYHTLKGDVPETGESPDAVNRRYHAAVEHLTAAKWFDEYGPG
jgi:hypothetical protein